MDTLPLSATRVSSLIKALLRKLEGRRPMTDGGLLERLADLAVREADEADVHVVTWLLCRLRELRPGVPLDGDEALLMREWVAARQRAAETFARFLICAHLRGPSPLPQPELMAFKRSMAAFGALNSSLTPTGAPTRGRGRPGCERSARDEQEREAVRGLSSGRRGQ